MLALEVTADGMNLLPSRDRDDLVPDIVSLEERDEQASGAERVDVGRDEDEGRHD